MDKLKLIQNRDGTWEVKMERQDGYHSPALSSDDAIKFIDDKTTEFNAALADPDVRGKIIKSGAVPVGGTPEALAAFMRAEYDKWGRVVRDHGIKEQ